MSEAISDSSTLILSFVRLSDFSLVFFDQEFDFIQPWRDFF
jgi:hypothetical protein